MVLERKAILTAITKATNSVTPNSVIYITPPHDKRLVTNVGEVLTTLDSLVIKRNNGKEISVIKIIIGAPSC